MMGGHMSHKTNTRGFTIVETMIVLAVTGGLFVAIAATLSGRTQAAEFTQTINTVNASIQQTISDVETGYYPNFGDLKCSAAGSSLNIQKASGFKQGTNSGCVFLGKVMQFGSGVNNGATPEEYATYVTAGLQSATTLSTADPTVLAPTPSETSSNFPNETEYTSLSNGLTVVSMYYQKVVGGPEIKINSVAFLTELSGTDVSYTGGSQQIDVIPTGSSLVTSQANTVSSINTALKSMTQNVNPAGGVSICFSDGGRSGLITIGENGRYLSTTLRTMSDKTC
jgi:type II secretory pathway pseudopilin PulG